MIIVGSIMRDSTAYLNRYGEQIQQLRKESRDPVFSIVAEGDSEDDTYEQLRAAPWSELVLKVEHAGGYYPSNAASRMRWRQLSVPCNAVLCAAVRMMDQDDAFVYVESDLTWESGTILSLVEHLHKYHAVSPMSYATNVNPRYPDRFYDHWGYQHMGRRFSEKPPYFHGWRSGLTNLVPINTSGSCFVLDQFAAERAQFSAFDCVRGIGDSLSSCGVQLWLDPRLEVRHP